MQLRGGGACGRVLRASCFVVFSVLVIRGDGGRRPPNDLDAILHPSKLLPPSASPTPWNSAPSPAKQAVLPAKQPSAPADHFDQAPKEGSPSIQSPGPIAGSRAGRVVLPPNMISPSVHTNPSFHGEVPLVSPPFHVQPPSALPTIAVSSPAIAPVVSHTPQSLSSPMVRHPPTLPSTGSPSVAPVASHLRNQQYAPLMSLTPRFLTPPTSVTPPTHQDLKPIASPLDKSSSQKQYPPKAFPQTSITPPSSQDKDGTPVAAPPSKLSSHNSSSRRGTRDANHSFPPKSITSPPMDGNKCNFTVSPPVQLAIQLSPQQRQRSHSNASSVSPSSITSAVHEPRYGVPVASPPKELSSPAFPANYSHVGGPFVSPPPTNSPTDHGKVYGIPAAALSKNLASLHLSGPDVPPASTITPSVLAPPNRTPHPLLPVNGSRMQRPASSSPEKISPVNHGKAHGIPVAAPSKGMHNHSLPVNNSYAKGPAISPLSNAHNIHRRHNYRHHKGSFPLRSPAPHKVENASATTHAPTSLHPKLPSRKKLHGPAPAPEGSSPSSKGKGNPAYAPRHPYHSPSYPPGSAHGPAISSKHRPKHAPPPYSQVLPPAHPPNIPALKKPEAPTPQPRSLPPPPPNIYCTPLSCQDPFTNSPPGTPCLCVMPIKVELRLGIALYTFFTLVAELAQEIASGVLMKQIQVRVMGANAATEDPEKTVVFIDLVPLGETFDYTTALLVYDKFWHKEVYINPLYFGNYDVLSVLYPGLPPAPPTAPGNMNNGLSNANDPRLHPLAVDVRSRNEKKGGGTVVIIVLSSVFAFVLCAGAVLVIYFKLRHQNHLTEALPTTPTKATGAGSMVVGSRLGSVPMSETPSFSSSIVPYKGTAKIFSLFEMERATSRFDASRIIGEGGFGRVYEGVLEDGQRVAVKVLKRDDQQGSREFLAEVEMLSRLHHRNLVKLIGICTEEHIRCLVYELVPNGSVESHLHGLDKETAPLDWDARLKIALGAARALAYLHEDSSPRVIHRDFKSSNILLEHDFSPKVSDFGLARSAVGEGNEHISTRVMGTFGYVAPEYAMTGHLLVKSDVYSYGVVLLELLTGRKPVDMLRPPGQENLVAWARPLLTCKDGLDTIVDPSLGSDIPFDNIAKVAAIASMCVQPEVDHRPFMGEVVQALKLVCNEGSEFKGSGSCSQEDLQVPDIEVRTRTSLDIEVDQVLSASDLFSASARYPMDASGSFRRYASSGPLMIGRSGQFGVTGRGLSTGSSSEHGVAQRFGMSFE